MGRGMCPPPMPALASGKEGFAQSQCGVFRGGGAGKMTGGGSAGSGSGGSGGGGGDRGMFGLVGELCIELHQFCLEVL